MASSRRPSAGSNSIPRFLDLGELEQLRDRLSDRIADARLRLRERAAVETANRELLRQMLLAPQDFKWVQVSRADVGEPGCGHWHSRPRLGPLGMLMGWWRVKVSSGCPLAGRLAAVERARRAGSPPPGSAARMSGRRRLGGTCRWQSWSSSAASSRWRSG